jgi:hypothetical protein
LFWVTISTIRPSRPHQSPPTEYGAEATGITLALRVFRESCHHISSGKFKKASSIHAAGFVFAQHVLRVRAPLSHRPELRFLAFFVFSAML